MEKILVRQFLRFISKGLIPKRLIIKVFLRLLEKLAKETDNDIDDKIIKTIKKLLKKEK